MKAEAGINVEGHCLAVGAGAMLEGRGGILEPFSHPNDPLSILTCLSAVTFQLVVVHGTQWKWILLQKALKREGCFRTLRCLHSSWCCPRVNCTLLPWDDTQATRRQQGQWGLERKVSLAHKTKRHLQFNKINKCCWKALPGLSHGGRMPAQFSWRCCHTTPRKALESLAWKSNKVFWKMIVSLMIIPLAPLWKEWVVLFTVFCC